MAGSEIAGLPDIFCDLHLYHRFDFMSEFIQLLSNSKTGNTTVGRTNETFGGKRTTDEKGG